MCCSCWPGKKKEASVASKPGGRHVKVKKDKVTARQGSELLNSLARLVRAVGVLVDALGRWF
nr:hypothetical protein [Actinomyces slackii]